MHVCSTISALIQVVDNWSSAIDCKYEDAVVFLDVQKVFNSVPHTHALKFNDYLLKWLSSYLYNRKHFVVVDGHVSPMLPVPSGVPQG